MSKRRLAGAVNGDFGGECPRVLEDAKLMSPTLAPTFDSIEDNVGASVLRRPVGCGRMAQDFNSSPDTAKFDVWHLLCTRMRHAHSGPPWLFTDRLHHALPVTTTFKAECTKSARCCPTPKTTFTQATTVKRTSTS